MNKTQLKNFAIAARVALIERVKDRARGFGIDKKTCEGGAVVPSQRFQTLGGELLTQTEISQRDALLTRIQSRGYEQVMEEAAYTWFNRFIALRYMQEHNLLPISVRVLPDAPGALPELVRQAQNVELDGVDFSHVVELLEGNQTETLYTELLIALCNQLSGVLPQMFEPISDYTELLFPDGLLREDSVLAMLAEVKEENWADIQVIGWLYQYYNTELKNETFELLKKNVKITKERIGAATQLFTPEWIVRYMVENSLGRLWLEGHDDPALRRHWRYYMDEAEQEPQVAAQLAQIRAQESRIQPEEIRLLDPCMGSGHILVYAFDVLMEIYRTQGYTDRDAVSAIVENNLYGLDIDDRAAQLAYFALMMKACEHDRRFLRRGIQPHVCAITEWSGSQTDEPAWSDAERRAAHMLRETFRDAKEFGSILSIPKPLADALNELGENPFAGEATLGVDTENLRKLATQAKIMARKYDVVVTNPPYMGSSGMGAKLAEFVKKQYPDSKSDMSTVFMQKCMDYCTESGYMSMINIPVWMFLTSYEKLRKDIIEKKTIVSMAHFGRGIFGSDFGTTSFVISNKHVSKYLGSYRRLFEKQGAVDSVEQKEEWYLEGKGRFVARQDNFEKIPGAPVAYNFSEKVFQTFEKFPALCNEVVTRLGMTTADNDRFVREWFEVSSEKCIMNAKSKEEVIQNNKKWVSYNKGGKYRKWYGNIENVVNWENDGYEIKNFSDSKGKIRSTVPNTEFYFRECGTWSKISSGKIAFRYRPVGSIFDVAGACMYSESDLLFYIAFCNSKVAMLILEVLSPTLNYEGSHIAALPVESQQVDNPEIEMKATECVEISKEDWDSFETSCDFKRHPLI